MNILEIAQAWYRKGFADEEIKAIADERRKVCDTCEENITMIGVEVCGKCFCPLAGKTFTEENSCPLMKWAR